MSWNGRYMYFDTDIESCPHVKWYKYDNYAKEIRFPRESLSGLLNIEATIYTWIFLRISNLQPPPLEHFSWGHYKSLFQDYLGFRFACTPMNICSEATMKVYAPWNKPNAPPPPPVSATAECLNNPPIVTEVLNVSLIIINTYHRRDERYHSSIIFLWNISMGSSPYGIRCIPERVTDM